LQTFVLVSLVDIVKVCCTQTSYDNCCTWRIYNLFGNVRFKFKKSCNKRNNTLFKD